MIPDSAASMQLCLLLVLMVPFALAGMALLNAGLGRSHSSAHSMLSALCVIAIAAIAYSLLGFSWQSLAGQSAHSFMLGGKPWNWLGAAPFGLRGVALESFTPTITALFQIFCVALAAVIPLSTGADRWRLGGICASTTLLAGFTYPMFAHWVWGGGWLASLGVNFGLGHGFTDLGGAATIQAVAGLNALTIAWILGPRQGKYGHGGAAAAIPGHNTLVALFGCMLMLPGWFGLNAAGAILFNGISASHVSLIAVNTLLSAAASGLAAVVLTRVRFTKPDASLSANGWVAGLVASSATCAAVTPLSAIVIGAIAGILVVYTVELLELRILLDDPAGAISVHVVAAIWGLISLGLFSRTNAPGQMLAQWVGVATLLGFVLPLAYALNWLANRLYPYRADEYGERQGMDLFELGAGAYPEFVVHGDDSRRR